MASVWEIGWRALTKLEPSGRNRAGNISGADTAANGHGLSSFVDVNRVQVAEINSKTTLETSKARHVSVTAAGGEELNVVGAGESHLRTSAFCPLVLPSDTLLHTARTTSSSFIGLMAAT
jgi:hypothetical protein